MDASTLLKVKLCVPVVALSLPLRAPTVTHSPPHPFSLAHAG
jgi:hypothetical protein